jgi:hypothetical protein
MCTMTVRAARRALVAAVTAIVVIPAAAVALPYDGTDPFETRTPDGSHYCSDSRQEILTGEDYGNDDRNHIGQVQLWWSSGCQTNWAEMVVDTHAVMSTTDPTTGDRYFVQLDPAPVDADALRVLNGSTVWAGPVYDLTPRYLNQSNQLYGAGITVCAVGNIWYKGMWNMADVCG